MTLRRATIDDLDGMVNLGIEVHKDYSFKSLNYNPEKVKETLKRLIESNQYVVVCEDKTHGLVGVMVGFVEESWFGSDLVAYDLTLFVKKDYRNKLLAFRLVDSFIRWAKLAGAKQIRPGVSTGSSKADPFYERLGFTKCGSNFYMESE